MNKYHFDYSKHQQTLINFFKKLEKIHNLDSDALARLKKQHTKPNGSLFKNSELVIAYKALAGKDGLKNLDKKILKKLIKRPVRTQSGVTPVTVLTKPFPCPGKCIFCPSDVRMPKSYLAQEPGAQRAERNLFDPYLQIYNRLQAYEQMGHNLEKVEIIVLGGTWSFYEENYQRWFIKECFRALNDFGVVDDRKKVQAKYNFKNKKNLEFQQEKINSQNKTYNQIISEVYVAPEKKLGLDKWQAASWEELFLEHHRNEIAKCRCVGLVLETRPDNISEAEVIRLRKLGATKTQIGVQSLDDEVLEKNHRGHTVAATKRAFALLRQAGFKIHAHWMANLYGSSVKKDQKDFKKLFANKNFRPDELKIYPCSLISSAELMKYYEDGRWQPYSYEELLEVLEFALLNTPPYCRLTRVIRDISSDDIVAGNKKTNFRQIVADKLQAAGKNSVDIRAREIKQAKFDPKKIILNKINYNTSVSDEIFLQYLSCHPELDSGSKLLAFLRLSLPKKPSFITELQDSAIIREIHVYGPAQNLGQRQNNQPQHLGLGTKLINEAKKISKAKGYKKLAVISAIGTREYYRKKGFSQGELYQFINL